MKRYKIYLVGFIFLLYLSFTIQGTNINVRKQDDKADINIIPLLTESNSVVYGWNRTWGGGDSDFAQGVAIDSSGNIFLAGYTESFGAGGRDMILVKYDGNGVQQWNRTWGGGDSDSGWGVVTDSLGNNYLAGHTWNFGAVYYDMVLVKYDGNGVQQWNYTWGGDSWDHGYGTVVDSSGNIYLAGGTYSFGARSSDMVLVKLVDNGSLERPPPDIIIMIIIIVSIVSVVGVGLVITFFIKKFRDN